MTVGFIPKHGGYRELLSYRKSQIVYDATVRFVERFLKKGDRTIDQMVQAARSGKQNIVEGSMASGTSKETEIKPMNVARASLEELLEDYRDFLRVWLATFGVSVLIIGVTVSLAGGGATFAALIARRRRNRNRIWILPEIEIPQRLGGAFCGGGGFWRLPVSVAVSRF